MLELGACVRLLGKCHPLGCDRMQQAKTKVAHFAKGTGRSDRKTFSLAATVTLNFPRVFDNAFWSMPCFLLFSKLNECRAPEKPVASYEQQLVFHFVQFEVIRVFSAMCLWLVLSHRHKRQFDAVPQSCVQFSCCVPVVHTLDHLHHR